MAADGLPNRHRYSLENTTDPNTPHSVSSVPVWSPHDQLQMQLPAAAAADHDCFMMSSDQFPGFSNSPPDWSLPSGDDFGAAAAAAGSSKSHSQAEKRRRDRINAQLARLRKLIPRSEKMDKAALLGSSVDHVKELKKKAQETSKGVTVPSELDEVIVEDCYGSDVLIKATLCCEDRPELFKDLLRALKGLKLMAVGAEIACLGGRVKTILILSATADQGGPAVPVASLKQQLKAQLSRIASFCNTSSPGFRLTSRRQRLLFPSSVS